MSSLTFARGAPLAPMDLSVTAPTASPSSPTSPTSPLPSSPTSAQPSNATSPLALPVDPASRATRAVPAPQLHNPYRREPGDTPFNTPASPRRAPIMAPRLSTSGPSGNIGHGVPSSLSTPLGEVRPLNVVSAMRGRGIIGVPSGGSGGRAVGIQGAGQNGGEVPHAFTPGNTPSSLERISKRMASNLMVGGGQGGGSAMNKIMPSYEFNAGLNEIGNRLDAHIEGGSGLRSPPQNMSPSMSQKNAPFLGAERTSSNGRSDWPSQYGGTTSSEDEHKEKKD